MGPARYGIVKSGVVNDEYSKKDKVKKHRLTTIMKERAHEFWNWFSANAAAYLFLREVDEAMKTGLLEDLKRHLHQYCERLGFEIGGDLNADQELIITAEGNADYFEFAEALIAEAPEIPRWTFHALIPPRGIEFEINIEDVTLRAGNMWFQPMGHPGFPEVTGIRVCFPDYEAVKDTEWILPAINKMVEYILGEKVYARNMHYIDLGELPEAPAEFGMIPLSNLEKYIQWRLARTMELIRSN